MSETRLNKLLEYFENEPQDPFISHALGLEFVKKGDWDKAREFYENVLQFNPDYLGTYYQLGKLYERTGKLNKAVITFEKGMELARRLKENQTYNELSTALEMIKDD